MKYHQGLKSFLFNTFGAGVRNIRTSKSFIKHALSYYFHVILQLNKSPGD